MRPRIGITCARAADSEGFFTLSTRYATAVHEAGGLPLLLPAIGEVNGSEWEPALDGLLLSGGGDIDPERYGEEPRVESGRIDPEADAFELALCRAFLELGKPILGVCRGAQVLNVAAGGDLYQDLFRQTKTRLQHAQKAPRWCATHRVQIVPGSLLAGIVKEEVLRVNSFHHQAVRRLAPGFIASASARDGIVEAVERPGDRFTLGVQWHPEHLHEPSASALFEAFVAAAAEGAQRRESNGRSPH